MKKLLILPASLLYFAFSVNAQVRHGAIAKVKTETKEANQEKKAAKKELKEMEGNEVGVMVKDHFYEDFGNIDPVWKRTKYFDEANFSNNGKPTIAYYDANAELVGTTAPVTFSDIPASAQRAIQRQYKGYEPVMVTLFDDNNANRSDMVLYGSAVSDGDSYFVEMKKSDKAIILKVNMEGAVSFFADKK